MQGKVMDVTDGRDQPEDEQRSLVIFQAGNDDWYVQVAPKHERATECADKLGTQNNCFGSSGRN